LEHKYWGVILEALRRGRSAWVPGSGGSNPLGVDEWGATVGDTVVITVEGTVVNTVEDTVVYWSSQWEVQWSSQRRIQWPLQWKMQLDLQWEKCVLELVGLGTCT